MYSCAACFYAALTGFLPPEALERLEHDTLVPVSQCGIPVPEYLDKAILKGLAVQPEDRFQNAEEFLEAIENQQVVELRQPEAPGAGTAPQPSGETKSRLRPAFAAGIAAAALVLAVGAGVWIGGGSRGAAAPGGETARPAAEAETAIDADAPTVMIAGEEYSTALTELRLESMDLTDADILLLSDPTRGIDVGTKYEIYQLIRRLAESGKTILLYSTENMELLGLCDRAAVFRDGEVAAVLQGEQFTEHEILKAALGMEETEVGA